MKMELTTLVIDGFSKGDPKSFQVVFDCYYRELFYFAWKMLANKEDAEDVVMQVFTKIFKRHAQFQTPANIKAFLFLSTRNLSIDYIRNKKYQFAQQEAFVERMKDDTDVRLESTVQYDLLEAIHNAVKQLPATCQTIFRMLIYEELKPAEIAEKLEISVDNVYNQKKRALQLLRLELKGNQFMLLIIGIALSIKNILSYF